VLIDQDRLVDIRMFGLLGHPSAGLAFPFKGLLTNVFQLLLSQNQGCI
jgi:hypothetical protein